jgi:hypothetical protein
VYGGSSGGASGKLVVACAAATCGQALTKATTASRHGCRLLLTRLSIGVGQTRRVIDEWRSLPLTIARRRRRACTRSRDAIDGNASTRSAK